MARTSRPSGPVLAPIKVQRHAGRRTPRPSSIAATQDSSAPSTRTALGVSGDSPRFSPDGTQIAYLDFSGGALHVMNADGTNGRAVSPTGYAYTQGSLDWSPDGQWLIAKRGEVLELVRVGTSETMP